MSEIRITVPVDPMTTSDNRLRRGGHWSQRAKAMRRSRELARMCWLQAGSPTVNGRVEVDVVVRRGRSVDVSNAVGGLKSAIDGLFVKGITPDDSPRYFTLGRVTLETGKQWRGKEECLFVIREVQP